MVFLSILTALSFVADIAAGPDGTLLGQGLIATVLGFLGWFVPSRNMLPVPALDDMGHAAMAESVSIGQRLDGCPGLVQGNDLGNLDARKFVLTVLLTLQKAGVQASRVPVTSGHSLGVQHGSASLTPRRHSVPLSIIHIVLRGSTCEVRWVAASTVSANNVPDNRSSIEHASINDECNAVGGVSSAVYEKLPVPTAGWFIPRPAFMLAFDCYPFLKTGLVFFLNLWDRIRSHSANVRSCVVSVFRVLNTLGERAHNSQFARYGNP